MHICARARAILTDYCRWCFAVGQEEPDVHYFAQLAALNDCLYRVMFRARFVVLVDLDEVLVPRRRRHWRPMLEVCSLC